MEFLKIKPTQWTTHLILCIAVLFSSAVTAQNNIGHIIYSTGEIQATNGGQSRNLKRGSAIIEGDVITSGSSTRSQLRMSDGALIAIRPNTEFSFDKYQYNENDDANNSSLFSLLKGGFRTITGLIGKKSKPNYRVRTSVATIGIRGTHYGLTLCQQGDCSADKGLDIEDGLYGSVVDGEITTENEAGEFVFSNDEFFHVVSSKSEPRSLLRPPGIIFDQGKPGKKLKKIKMAKKTIATRMEKRQLQNAGMINAVALIKKKKNSILLHTKPGFEATNDTNKSPNSFIDPADIGNVMAYSFYAADPGTAAPFSVQDKFTNNGTAANQFFLNSVAKEKGLFVPVIANQTITLGPVVRKLSIRDAKPVEPGSMTIGNTSVGWGRWSGQYAVIENGAEFIPKSDLHYVIASDVTKLARLNSLTGTVAYTTVAGTRATDLNGNVAAGVANVNMGVTFGFGVDTFNVRTNVGGKTYQARTTTIVPFSAALTGGLNLSGGTSCPSCVGQASIAFFGTNAGGAGTVYNIKNQTSNNVVNGTAILTR